MPENAVPPTAQSRGRRRPGLASGLMARIVAATTALWAGPPRLSDAPAPPSDDSFGIAALETDGGWDWQDGRPAFSVRPRLSSALTMPATSSSRLSTPDWSSTSASSIRRHRLRVPTNFHG